MFKSNNQQERSISCCDQSVFLTWTFDLTHMCLTLAEEVLEKKMVHAAFHAFGSGQTQVLRHLSADLVISLNLSIFIVYSCSKFNLFN